MERVILKADGTTIIIKNGKILKKHFTTSSDTGFYKNLGYKVEIENSNFRIKRRIA